MKVNPVFHVPTTPQQGRAVAMRPIVNEQNTCENITFPLLSIKVYWKT